MHTIKKYGGFKVIKYINNKNRRIEHCKISVVGNVDSGKSTLVGVITKGGNDDGNG